MRSVAGSVMTNELRRLVVLPIAMVLFLCAAATSPGLMLRTNAAMQTAGTNR
jgi:hypothetical protein